MYLSFLQPWLFRSLSAGLQLVFTEHFFPLVDVFLICSWGEVSCMSSNILHWFALPLNGFQMSILELLYIKGISIYTFTRSMMNLYCDALNANEYYPLVCLPIRIFRNIHFLFISQHLSSDYHRSLITQKRRRMGAASLMERFLQDVLQHHPCRYQESR